MDAEVAALLGAAVGSLATLGAAFVTGRAAARSQFDQWRRQHRRDAYVSCLAALYDRDIAMDAISEALEHASWPMCRVGGPRPERALV
ncbi:hypothetical protein ACWF9B_02850 [Streptomyces sp. NPDC055089]